MKTGFIDVRGIVRLCACGCGQPTPVAKVSDPRRGYVKGEQTRYLHGHRSRPPRTVDTLLTGRELSVLKLAAVGLTSQQAGPRLGTTVRAVDERINSACRKLGADSRTHAVVLAIRLGLIGLEDVELTAKAAAAVAATAAAAEPDRDWANYSSEPAGRRL